MPTRMSTWQHSISNSAAQIFSRANQLTNSASGYVHSAEQGITNGLHAAEDWIDQGAHGLAGRVASVPAVGWLAQDLAVAATDSAQLAGGFLGGAATMVGGAASSLLHPIDTATSMFAMFEHTRGPIGIAARGAHDLIDVVRGQQTLPGMLERAINPASTQKEDEEFWNKALLALTDPYRQSIQQGRYGEVLGRGVFDVGSLLLGVGEAAEAARGAEAAGELSKVSQVTKAAEVAPSVGKRPPGLDIDAIINERAAATRAESLRPASSATQQDLLGEHLRQNQKYGTERQLPDGRIRYSGEVNPARTPGEMAGRRVTREWNPETGQHRTWQETVDHQGRIRQVRPEESCTGGKKVHYRFAQDGKYQGKW